MKDGKILEEGIKEKFNNPYIVIQKIFLSLNLSLRKNNSQNKVILNVKNLK